MASSNIGDFAVSDDHPADRLGGSIHHDLDGHPLTFKPKRNHHGAAACLFPATRRWCRRFAFLANGDRSLSA